METINDLDMSNDFFVALQLPDKKSFDEVMFWAKESKSDVRVVRLDDLRRTGIDDIKELKSEMIKEKGLFKKSNILSKIEYIKKKFNITKEDLK